MGNGLDPSWSYLMIFNIHHGSLVTNASFSGWNLAETPDNNDIIFLTVLKQDRNAK